ncbi:YbjQ family protein [Pleomorphomonas koreensis]|uniref:YbjQ family protein n=1 Tax=Pleomorphomonas koreensis TaxID=257440 RepID=UPI001FDF5AC0|nr:heavy metal-binding domain-containing protein [Pleomorphomonas koreensis]
MQLDDEAIDRDRQMLSQDRTTDVPIASVDKAASEIILTTAFDVPGREIGKIIDIVGAEVATGMNIFKDIANAWRDTFGGRSNTVQNALRDARTQCLVELRREAFRLGADAVIAVRIAYSEASVATGTGGGILFVSATGTAVSLAD